MTFRSDTPEDVLAAARGEEPASSTDDENEDNPWADMEVLRSDDPETVRQMHQGHTEEAEPNEYGVLVNDDGQAYNPRAWVIEDDESADEPADDGEMDGQTKGALGRAWQRYKGALGGLREDLPALQEDWEHAQEAARAINSIREEHGQDPLDFRALEEIQRDLSHWALQAREDCVECHGLAFAADGEAGEVTDDRLVDVSTWEATRRPRGSPLPTAYEGGPYTVEVTDDGDGFGVVLRSEREGEDEHVIARDLAERHDATVVASEVVARVKPDEVSTTTSDAAVREAATAARQAVDDTVQTET